MKPQISEIIFVTACSITGVGVFVVLPIVAILSGGCS